jgi:hypothetical protein
MDANARFLSPYYSTYIAGRKSYLNPDTVQILSAGRDGLFGSADLWAPQTGSTDPLGLDDQSNFSDRPLGVPPQ